MKRIVFSAHARSQLALRGATESEVTTAIQKGEEVAAKQRRTAFRKNFRYQSQWMGKFYESKQVLAIVVDEGEALVVVTVYVFYIGGSH